VHPGSRIQDGKNSDPGSGIQDGKKFGSRIRDGKTLDPGSRIRDKHPRSAKLEIVSPNLLGLKESTIIEPFVQKAFWDETKSFLQSKFESVVIKRGNTPVNLIFQSPTRNGCRRRTISPGEKPLLQLTFIRP
jgi:hypothetical protein